MPDPAEGLLACTVRDCGEPLARDARTWRCPRGHAFDVARRGQVNLLQPQDRRSRDAGDPTAAVEARARLLDAGIGLALLEEVAGRLAAESGPVVDLGCGTGHLLGRLASQRPSIGIDLSAAAIDLAARRFPGVTWVVANADRRLPLVSGRVAAVVSVHGRRNPAEVARVLAPGGRLLVAVPAPDDLAELRAVAQGTATARERVSGLVAELEPWFALEEHQAVRTVHRLERPALLDLLHGTYRGARAGVEARCAELDVLAVTLASELCVFSPRE